MENGDTANDISQMSFWSKLSSAGVECAQSRLSSVRKLGCALIAAMAVASNDQNGKFNF